MPNTIDAVVPRILTAGLVALRENAVMPRLVRTDLNGYAAQKGSSVDVPIPSSMGVATDVIPSTLPTAGTDISPTFVPIKLNRWKESKFTLTDLEIGRMMEGYIPLQITEAAKALANAIDSDILSLYKAIYGMAGQAGQTPFQPEISGAPAPFRGLVAAGDARKVLNRQLCPVNDRRIVLDVEAEANATTLPSFAAAYASDDPMVITEAIIGRKLGFDWAMDQNVQRHTTGSAGAYFTSVAAVAGATTLTMFNGGGTPIEGDAFFLAGQTQAYVLKAGSTTTSWNISPPLRAAVPANTGVTLVAAHTVNLAFHRDAFGFVMRSLTDVVAPGSLIETYTDNLTGIPLRLEITRQNKQTAFSFDCLWGMSVLRAEMACRILGL